MVLLVTQLGAGLYGLMNYESLIEKGLNETLYAAKDNQVIASAWQALQHEVSTKVVVKRSKLQLSSDTINYRESVAVSINQAIGNLLLDITNHYR